MEQKVKIIIENNENNYLLPCYILRKLQNFHQEENYSFIEENIY